MRRNALVSVSDKTGVVELARELVALGFRVLSTGGTARHLREAGIEVTDVSEVTGFPEMMDGRVKTLHPRIHAGILAVRNNADHMAQLAGLGIETIDVVVVNLYPFEQTISRQGVTDEEAIENIDIGGPTLLRASAKNHADVTVIVDPADYGQVLSEVREHGNTLRETRRTLARKVFDHTSRYDAAIASYLCSQ